jgi:hypothetical protein
LFGELSQIIVDAQAYEQDPWTDDHELDELDEDITDEELEWLAQKRKRVHFTYILPQS